VHLGYPKLARWACRRRFCCELVHLQRLIFALSLETNLRASVELRRLRTWSVETRDFGRPPSALDEVSPKSAVREDADQARVVRSTIPVYALGLVTSSTATQLKARRPARTGFRPSSESFVFRGPSPTVPIDLKKWTHTRNWTRPQSGGFRPAPWLPAAAGAAIVRPAAGCNPRRTRAQGTPTS
jgi:hypothetical protein